MTCQHCGKRPAVTQYKRIINGKVNEQYLCEACTRELGLPHMLGGFTIGNFWGGLFGEPARRAAETVRCGGCGKDFKQITESGNVGCAACYTTFYDQLLPSIQRIHGKTRHIGKIPKNLGADMNRTCQSESPEIQKKVQIEQLNKQLERHIANQEYERCAELRDQIKTLEDTVTQVENPRNGGAVDE